MHTESIIREDTLIRSELGRIFCTEMFRLMDEGLHVCALSLQHVYLQLHTTFERNWLIATKHWKTIRYKSITTAVSNIRNNTAAALTK